MTYMKRTFGIVLAALIFLAATPVPAEIRGGRVDNTIYVLTLGIGDSADPIVCWELVTEWEAGSGKPLNPSGAARGTAVPTWPSTRRPDGRW